jgi:hypothetical protein
MMLFNGSRERTQISLTGSDAVREEIAVTGYGSPSAFRAPPTRPGAASRPGPGSATAHRRNMMSAVVGVRPSVARACRAWPQRPATALPAPFL